jgi:hypothetical protein
MKRITILLAVLALVAVAAPAEEPDETVLESAIQNAPAEQWVDTDVPSLIENAPTVEDYPDASAVFLKLQEAADVAEDGSVVVTRNKLIQVLTLRGRERHSNQSFLFNTDLANLSLIKGVTQRESGRVIEVEPDAINEVTPAFLEDATIYSNVMQKVISFPMVGPGATMELQLREDHKPAPDGSYSGIEYMGATDPILDASFSIKYPLDSDAPTAVGYTGSLGSTTIMKTAERGEIMWSVTNVPALVEEENMPPASWLYPMVIYSSYGTWDQPAAFFAGEFFPHVQTGGAIAERVAEVTRGASSPAERERAIFMDVATGVRNVDLSLGLGGYTPNDAMKVLENKYGDTRDKAVLLISMLRAAGVDAYPALVATFSGARFTQEVPTLDQFSRVLVAIPNRGAYRYLDPFLDDVSYGYLRWGRGNTALVVRDDGAGELVSVPRFRAPENHAVRRMTVALDADGNAVVSADCALTGYFDRKARMAMKDATPTEEEKLFEFAANRVTAGATDFSHSHSDMSDLTAPVTISQRIHAGELAVPQGDMMIVHLPPYPHTAASTGVYPNLAERSYAFEFPCEFTSDTEIRLELPEGYEVAWMPEPVSLGNQDVLLTLGCEKDENAHAVVWTSSVTVNEHSIPVDRYASLKEDFDTLASPKNQLVLLRKS